MKHANPAFELSVVIVNYNVAYFLEQCLNSVLTASQGLRVQVFVVDNNSVDGSVAMVQQKFPTVCCIANTENVGFSKANNQAMLQSDARYILLLNPDTVVEEDTFSKCIQYMDAHPQAGGLGVRMIDGKGRFLPESKRGLPTPAVSFYKIFGLSRFFPKSKRFGRYHLGFLDEFETHEVDVLSGAFMFMRSETLQKVGLLDEAFFMYGEDIDLSYRIQLGGYTNVYFPATKIIHYKGESTKKGSINYVFVFYKAMVIFAKKHFSQRYARMFSIAIHLAIYFRASLSLLRRFVSAISLPAADATCSFFALSFLSEQWKIHHIYFPTWIQFGLIPIYIASWMLAAWFFGLYEKQPRVHQIWKSSALGTLCLLAAYALFPKDWQFSRLFVLLGSASFILVFYGVRMTKELLQNRRIDFGKLPKKRFGIVANSVEYQRISELLQHTYPEIETHTGIWVSEAYEAGVGSLGQLAEVSQVHRLNELIFSAKDLSSSQIIELMAQTSGLDIDYKIAQPDTHFLIGSNSIDRAGEFYSMHFNALQQPVNRRIKRLFDLSFALLSLFLFSPVFWRFKHPLQFYKNCVRVLFAQLTFVGISTGNSNQHAHRKSILRPFLEKNQDQTQANILYTKEYRLVFELKSWWYQWQQLDALPE
jgi:GT2 family glycosyltransferase